MLGQGKVLEGRGAQTLQGVANPTVSPLQVKVLFVQKRA